MRLIITHILYIVVRSVTTRSSNGEPAPHEEAANLTDEGKGEFCVCAGNLRQRPNYGRLWRVGTATNSMMIRRRRTRRGQRGMGRRGSKIDSDRAS